jgi:hypothetical protein
VLSGYRQVPASAILGEGGNEMLPSTPAVRARGDMSLEGRAASTVGFFGGEEEEAEVRAAHAPGWGGMGWERRRRPRPG